MLKITGRYPEMIQNGNVHADVRKNPAPVGNYWYTVNGLKMG